jgi:hypothetical protein
VYTFTAEVEQWTLVAYVPATEQEESEFNVNLWHSCDPTVFMVKDEHGTFLFAARPCKPGDPVTYANKDNLIAYPVGLRSKALEPYLQDRPEFDDSIGCLCRRCAEERADDTSFTHIMTELATWQHFLTAAPLRFELHQTLLKAKQFLETGLRNDVEPCALPSYVHETVGPEAHLELLQTQTWAVLELWTARDSKKEYKKGVVDALITCETLTAMLMLRDFVCFHATSIRVDAHAVSEGVHLFLKLEHELTRRGKTLSAVMLLQLYTVCLCGLSLDKLLQVPKQTRRALWRFLNSNPACLEVLATYHSDVSALCLQTADKIGLHMESQCKINPN